jgi:hypothetical protein
MATQFHFEHVFRAASIDDVFSAYFDPAHLRQQDQQLEISERLVIEQTDDGETLRWTCKVTPRRQLPAIVRPFLAGPLHYLETATWRRADRTIEVEIWPSLLRKKPRPTVTALYRLSQLPDGGIRRSYEGLVSVDLPVFSTRIEHGIVGEFERSLPVAATCTQAFLDRGGRYVSARA